MTTATARKLKHWHPLERVIKKYEKTPPRTGITLKQIASESGVPYNTFHKPNYDALRNRALKLTAIKPEKVKVTKQKRTTEELAVIAQAIKLEAESLSDRGERIKSLTDFLAGFGLWMHVYKKSAAFDQVRPLVRSLMSMPIDARDLEMRDRLQQAIEMAKINDRKSTLSTISQDARFSDFRGLRNPVLADLYLEAADVAGVVIPDREKVEARAKKVLEDVAYFNATRPKSVAPEDQDIDPDSGVDLSVCRVPSVRKKMTWKEYWSFREGRAL